MLQPWLARDWASYAAGLADEVVLEDRRRLFRFRADGRDAVVEFARSVVAIGVTAVDVLTIATRGDLLSLTRDVHRGAQGETEVLQVQELAVDGRFVGAWFFDADD